MEGKPRVKKRMSQEAKLTADSYGCSSTYWSACLDQCALTKLTGHVLKLNHRSTAPQIMFVFVNLSQPSTVLFVLLSTLLPSFPILMCRPSTIRTIIGRSHTLMVLFERSRTQRHRFYPISFFTESWEWRFRKMVEEIILREKGCL